MQISNLNSECSRIACPIMTEQSLSILSLQKLKKRCKKLKISSEGGKKEIIQRILDKNETIASAHLLAKYQTLVYGNDQLLLKQRNSFNVIGKNNIIPNPAH
eukprot:542452_1